MRQLKPKQEFSDTKHARYVPDYWAQSVGDIDFAKLHEDGVRGIAVDVDSTLVVDSTIDLDDELREYLQAQKDKGYFDKICIATNRYDEMGDLPGKLDACVVQAKWLEIKPSRTFYRRLIDAMELPPAQIAMIGDRVVQDVYGANRMGLVSVLVEPLGRIPLVDKLLLRRWRDRRKLRRYSDK